MSANLTISTQELEEGSDRKALAVPSHALRDQTVSGDSKIAGVVGIAIVVVILGLSIYFAWVYLM